VQNESKTVILDNKNMLSHMHCNVLMNKMEVLMEKRIWLSWLQTQLRCLHC